VGGTITDGERADVCNKEREEKSSREKAIIILSKETSESNMAISEYGTVLGVSMRE
jgi:hypothetical protein